MSEAILDDAKNTVIRTGKWLKTWQETHLHVRSVLCHLRPDRAYRFLLFLFFMSSFPTISGREQRGVDMSLMVALSGAGVGHMWHVETKEKNGEEEV